MASQWEKDMMNLLGPQNPTELEWYGDPRCLGESSSPSLVSSSESYTDTGSPGREGSEIVTIPRTPQKNSCRPERIQPTRAERLENVV